MRINHTRGIRNGDCLRIRAQLTAAEYSEVRRMSRSWLRWPGVVAQHHTALVLGAGLIVATIGALTYGDKDGSWYALAAVWLVIGAVAAWAVRNRRKKTAADLLGVNARLPKYSVVSSDGIRFERGVGAEPAAILTWRSVTKWREGRLVIVLFVRNRAFFPLPKMGLEPQELEYLRGLLSTSIAASRMR